MFVVFLFFRNFARASSHPKEGETLSPRPPSYPPKGGGCHPDGNKPPLTPPKEENTIRMDKAPPFRGGGGEVNN